MKIEIFSDIVCPWCFIGKRRLDPLLEGPLGVGVEVVWRAYLLYPSIPAGGIPRAEFDRGRETGDHNRARREALLEQGREVGLRFDFAGIAHQPSTVDAHRLLALARDSAGWRTQHRLAEILFRLHFCDLRDVGDRAVLRHAGEEAGLAASAVEKYLASDRGHEAVAADVARARDLGVSGVPCCVFDAAYTLPGAQTADVIAHFLQRVKHLRGTGV